MLQKLVEFSPPFVSPDALLDLNKCGPDMLPPSLTFTYPSPPSSALEYESRLIQRGYTPQDVEACAQLQRNLDAAGEAGLDLHDLCKTHTLLEDPRSGRTRNLLQYMKVSRSLPARNGSFQHGFSVVP